MALPTLPSSHFVNVDFERLFPVQPTHRLLDVGCGDGRHVSEACLYAGRIIGLEISRQNLLATRKRVEERALLDAPICRPDLIQADAQHLPFKDGVFDRVICTEVVEHLPDDRAAFREMVRVLRSGGLIAVSTPAFLPEFLFWHLTWRYTGHAEGHVRIYGPGKLAQALRAFGLHVYAIRGKHALEVIYWFLACLSGLPPREPRLARLYRAFKHYQEYRRDRDRTAWRIEALANFILPKDRVVYAQKPVGTDTSP